MAASAAQKIEAGISSETLLQFYNTTPHHMPEDHNFLVISTFLFIISRHVWECYMSYQRMRCNCRDYSM